MLDIAAKPQNRSTSVNFLYSVVSCSIVLVPMSPKNSIQFVSDNDKPREFIFEICSVFLRSERKNIWHGSDRTRDGQGKDNASVEARRHKNLRKTKTRAIVQFSLNTKFEENLICGMDNLPFPS